MMKNYIWLILGMTILLLANWPSIGVKYFPYNLPFCAIGGILAGWNGSQIICKHIFKG